jgi:hypothetical protein
VEQLDSSENEPEFGGVLADAEFDDQSSSERFRHFQQKLRDQLQGLKRPKVRFRLLSSKEIEKLQGSAA